MIKTNKTALITGSAHRLGKAIAEELHQRGIDIAIHCSESLKDAEQLSQQFNRVRPKSSCVIKQDLSQINAEKSIIEQALRFFGRLDYLVNNAAIFYPTPMTHPLDERTEFNTEEEISQQRLLSVNFVKPYQLAISALPQLKINRGAIVNIIDIYTKTGLAEHCHYVASKSALMEISQHLAIQFAPDVRVNCVSPGAILWPENGDDKDKLAPAEQQKIAQQHQIIENTALKKRGSALDIAKTVSYLLLDASYTTGATIAVDGGRKLYL